MTDPTRGLVRAIRAVVLAGLFLWTWQVARAPMNVDSINGFIHNPNLVFHEAGHVILGFFGRFISVLGGSLFQCLLPLILAGVFLRERNPFAAVICTWWFGENLLDVAVYIADARALELVLIGGHTGAAVEGHDWEYLLTQMGWLHLDTTIGRAVWRTGLVVMFAAIAWGTAYVARHRAGPDLTFPEGNLRE